MSTNRHTKAEYTKRTTPPTQEELFGGGKPSEIDLGLLQMQILWILSRKSTHGYDMMKDLTAMRSKKMTQGTLYPTLQRLEELGHVKRREEENKVIYKITAKGNKTMHDTCIEFCKTFFGIFHDYACMKCVGSNVKVKGGK